MEKYIKRLIEEDLEDYLDIIGAVLIVGPNGVEKQQQLNNMLKVYLNYKTPIIENHIYN